MSANTTRLFAPSALLAATLFSAACTPRAPVAPEQAPVAREQAPVAPEKAPETSNQAEVTEQMKDVLAKADQVDGTADKIVSKCAACDLAMDGVTEDALKVGQYTLLFCSDDCKQAYAKDLEKSVLAIKLPEPKATP